MPTTRALPYLNLPYKILFGFANFHSTGLPLLDAQSDFRRARRAYRVASRPGALHPPLARALGLSRSTAHRYVATLARLGYLQQNAQTRKYRLGSRVLDLGFSARGTYEGVASSSGCPCVAHPAGPGRV